MVLHIEAIAVDKNSGRSFRYYLLSDDRSIELNILNDASFMHHMTTIFEFPTIDSSELMSLLKSNCNQTLLIEVGA